MTKSFGYYTQNHKGIMKIIQPFYFLWKKIGLVSFSTQGKKKKKGGVGVGAEQTDIDNRTQ